MNATKRYFLCCDMRDKAQREHASDKRLSRLKAWEDALADEARREMRSPWTIDDLFATMKHALS